MDKVSAFLTYIGKLVSLKKLEGNPKWEMALGLAVLIVVIVLLIMLVKPMVSGYLVSGAGSARAGLFNSASGFRQMLPWK